MTNTCEIISFLTDRYYEMLPTAQLLINDTNESNKTESEDISHAFDNTTAPNNTTMGDGNDLDARTMIEFTANTIAHLSMFFIMAGMTYKCFKLGLQKTALHAFLCTLGLYMLSEGVQVRYPCNPLFYRLSWKAKTASHIFLQVTGGLVGLCGTLHKFMLKKKHFNTNHGKFGLVSLAFWCFNVVVGLITVFLDDPYSGITHNIIGLFTYSFFMFTQWIGYDSGFFRRNFDNSKNYKWLTVISLFLSVIAPVQLCVNKII